MADTVKTPKYKTPERPWNFTELDKEIEYARQLSYSGVDIEEAHTRIDKLASAVASLSAIVEDLAKKAGCL